VLGSVNSFFFFWGGGEDPPVEGVDVSDSRSYRLKLMFEQRESSIVMPQTPSAIGLHRQNICITKNSKNMHQTKRRRVWDIFMVIY